MKVAIIPARGGSKRIPKKNIRLFAGKPLISYSIEAAIKSNIFDRVVISTDSAEIAETAEKYGGEVPFLRAPELSDDHTGTDAVVLNMLEFLEREGGPVKHVCCIYATAPFISAKDLIRGYEMMTEQNASSAFTVATFPSTIFRALRLNEAKRLEMIWPQHRLTRSQDLEEAYFDAGQFYWADAARYKREKTFWSSDAVPIIISRDRVQDIDTPEDWLVAEKLFKLS